MKFREQSILEAYHLAFLVHRNSVVVVPSQPLVDAYVLYKQKLRCLQNGNVVGMASLYTPANHTQNTCSRKTVSAYLVSFSSNILRLITTLETFLEL